MVNKGQVRLEVSSRPVTSFLVKSVMFGENRTDQIGFGQVSSGQVTQGRMKWSDQLR